MSTLIKNQFTLDDGDCLFRSKDFFMHNRNQGDLYLEVVKGNSTSGVSCYFNQKRRWNVDVAPQRNIRWPKNIR